MIRNLKIGTGFVITTIKGFIIAYLMFLIYIYLFINSNIIPAYELNNKYDVFIKISIIVVFDSCWQIFVQFQSYAFKDALTFSITRKSFYISSQILKFVLCISLSLLYLLFYNVLNIIFNFNRQIIDLAFLLFASTIFIISINELCINIINLVGRTKVFSILNFIIGFSSMIIISIITLENIEKSKFTYFICTILLLTSIVISIISWLLLKRCSLVE